MTSTIGGWWHKAEDEHGRTYYYNRVLNVSKWQLDENEASQLASSKPVDPYNNTAFLPLHQFIDSKDATELLHNGETFQVLGLTNYSHWSDAHELRRCISSSHELQEQALQFAVQRLRSFLHVGTFERKEESAASLAMMRNVFWNQRAYKGGVNEAFTYEDSGKPAGDDEGADASAGEPRTGVRMKQVTPDEELQLGLSVAQMYHRCSRRAQNRNLARRRKSMEAVSQMEGQAFEFSREGRALVPEAVLDAIRARNWMDVELHRVAGELLEQRIARAKAEGRWVAMPEAPRHQYSGTGSDHSVNQHDEL